MKMKSGHPKRNPNSENPNFDITFIRNVTDCLPSQTIAEIRVSGTELAKGEGESRRPVLRPQQEFISRSSLRLRQPAPNRLFETPSVICIH
jgi:hypothetical protein